MSRQPLPRRFAYAPGGVLAALAVLAAASAWESSAQTTSAPAGQQPGAIIRLNANSNAANCTRRSERSDYSDEALRYCDRALDHEQLNRVNLIATYINRGNMYLRRNDGAAALADFTAVTTLDPANAEAKLNRGVALIMQQRFGEAVASITEALSLGVSEPHKAYYNRGAAREALGDARGAYEDYSTALEIQPDWGPANAELRRLAAQRQQWLGAQLENDDSQAQ